MSSRVTKRAQSPAWSAGMPRHAITESAEFERWSPSTSIESSGTVTGPKQRADITSDSQSSSSRMNGRSLWMYGSSTGSPSTVTAPSAVQHSTVCPAVPTTRLTRACSCERPMPVRSPNVRTAFSTAPSGGMGCAQSSLAVKTTTSWESAIPSG